MVLCSQLNLSWLWGFLKIFSYYMFASPALINQLNRQLRSRLSRAKLGLGRCDKHGLSINPTAPYLDGRTPLCHPSPACHPTSLTRPSHPSLPSKDCLLERTNQSSPCITGSRHAPGTNLRQSMERAACAITTNFNQWARRASSRGRIFATWLMLKMGEWKCAGARFGFIVGIVTCVVTFPEPLVPGARVAARDRQLPAWLFAEA